MSKGLIRWKLNEIMARHRIKGKDLANHLGVSANAISMLKNAPILPEIGGERWEQICEAINELSQINEPITPFDMIEYIPSESASKDPTAQVDSSKSSKAKRTQGAA
jgi:putative transcriptional regulator